MIYSNPKDLIKIRTMCNPKEFLHYMFQSGEPIQFESYANDVTELCNNAVAWMCLKMDDLFRCNSTCVVGEFEGQDHAWIEIGDYIIDMTLAQFISDAPEIAIINKKDAKGYHTIKKMGIKQFCKEQVVMQK